MCILGFPLPICPSLVVLSMLLLLFRLLWLWRLRRLRRLRLLRWLRQRIELRLGRLQWSSGRWQNEGRAHKRSQARRRSLLSSLRPTVVVGGRHTKVKLIGQTKNTKMLSFMPLLFFEKDKLRSVASSFHQSSSSSPFHRTTPRRQQSR